MNNFAKKYWLVVLVGSLFVAAALVLLINRHLISSNSNELDAVETMLSMTSTNLFDPNTIEVGSEVAGMHVTSIGPLLPNVPYSPDHNFTAYFRGETTVAGTYIPNDPDSHPGFDYFLLDEPLEISKLPMTEAVNEFQLCFRNPKATNDLFNPFPQKTTATVKIGDFRFQKPGTTWVCSNADLIEVISKQ